MRHPRITIAAIVISLGAAAGGVAIASTAGGASSASGQPVTIRAATANVGGKTETILVDAKGEPLYTFKTDTPATSHVSGQLAALWPPVVASSGSPELTGAGGKLTVVPTANGKQIAYNGRFLYSFVDDSPGHVTGQGVQDFFIATADPSGPAAPANSASANSYGY